MRRRRAATLIGLACLAVAVQGSGTASPGTTRAAPRPPIALRLIPFGAARRAETAAYARRHYGIDTWRLVHPHVIVEHMLDVEVLLVGTGADREQVLARGGGAALVR